MSKPDLVAVDELYVLYSRPAAKTASSKIWRALPFVGAALRIISLTYLRLGALFSKKSTRSYYAVSERRPDAARGADFDVDTWKTSAPQMADHAAIGEQLVGAIIIIAPTFDRFSGIRLGHRRRFS